MKPILQVACELGFADDKVTPYGKWKAKIGRPRDFTVLVRRLEVAAGAGFNIAYLGDVVMMPGLPKRPSAENIDLTDDGVITGLF